MKLWKEQVEPELDNCTEIEIVFPKEIEGMTTLFVYGFISFVLEVHSKEELVKYVSIEAHENVKEKFWSSVFY